MKLVPNKSFIGRKSLGAGDRALGAEVIDKPSLQNVPSTTKSTEHTDDELVTFSVSKYDELRKAVEDSRKITPELYGTVDLCKTEMFHA